MSARPRTSRRTFLRRTTFLGAGAAAAGMLPAGLASASPAPQETPGEWDLEVDVLVAGSGIAGMCAAIEAAQAGATTLVLEKAPYVGGNSKWAGGFDLESPTFEEMREHDPEGDPVLQQVMVDNFADDIAWLQEMGVELNEIRPGRFDFVPYLGEGGIEAFSILQGVLEEAGGEIMLETALVKLITNDVGDVIGALAKGPDGPMRIGAGAVVVATGSCGQSDDFKVRYLGMYGDRTSYYGTPYHQGDGLRVCLEVGAALSSGMSIADGGLVFPPPFQAPDEANENLLTGAAMSEPVPSGVQNLFIRPPAWGEPVMLVNLHGKRYVDESARYTVIGWKTTAQPEGIGFVVFDQTVYESRQDILEAAVKYGATMFQADTIEELAEQMRDWKLTQSYNEGVAVDNFLATFEEFNAAMAKDGGLSLDPPRRANPQAIETPPFYAVPAVQGVVDLIGGVRINENAQALDTMGQPIPGLFVAGEDSGRPYTVEHGGLSYGLTFGRIAGRSAAAAATGSAE